jgi:hypothetical protein
MKKRSTQLKVKFCKSAEIPMVPQEGSTEVLHSSSPTSLQKAAIGIGFPSQYFPQRSTTAAGCGGGIHHTSAQPSEFGQPSSPTLGQVFIDFSAEMEMTKLQLCSQAIQAASLQHPPHPSQPMTSPPRKDASNPQIFTVDTQVASKNFGTNLSPDQSGGSLTAQPHSPTLQPTPQHTLENTHHTPPQQVDPQYGRSR